MLSEQPTQGRTHSQNVERLRHPKGSAPEQGVADGMVPDGVPVCPANRIKARVKPLPGLTQADDRNVIRQNGVPGTLQVCQGVRPTCLKGDDLPQGMDPSIGAPSPNETGRFSGNLFECCFQDPLNGTPGCEPSDVLSPRRTRLGSIPRTYYIHTSLPLKSGKVSPIVSDGGSQVAAGR
jgi:hypothetical protein